MSLTLKFRPWVERLSRPLLLELEQLLVTWNAQWGAEHEPDGTHSARRSITLTDGAGGTRYLWVDATGDLRVGTAPPETSDTGGTVVGTQS